MNVAQNEVVDRLLNSELAEKASREIVAEKIARRIALLEEINHVKEPTHTKLSDARADVETAKSELEETRSALKIAEQNYLKACQRVESIVQGIDGKTRRLNRELYVSAPIEIDDAISRLKEKKFEIEQKNILEKRQPKTVFDKAKKELVRVYSTKAEKIVYEVFSTRPSTMRALAAIKDAIAKFERLKYTSCENLESIVANIEKSVSVEIVYDKVGESTSANG